MIIYVHVCSWWVGQQLWLQHWIICVASPFKLCKDSMKSVKVLALLLTPVMAQPDWCRWVPLASQQYVPECSGYSYPGYANFGCANWCQWVPGPSWGYTSGCAGCYGLYSTHYQSVTVPATALQNGCQAGCEWVSRPAWANASDCSQCEKPMVLDSKPDKTGQRGQTGQTGLKVKALSQPNWCQWVPLSSLQYVGECNGSVGSAGQSQKSCANWCGWLPSSSWQYTPECNLCTGQGPVMTSAKTGCLNWCQWVPRPSWQHTPDCSQCGVQPTPLDSNQTAGANSNISSENLP